MVGYVSVYDKLSVIHDAVFQINHKNYKNNDIIQDTSLVINTEKFTSVVTSLLLMDYIDDNVISDNRF